MDRAQVTNLWRAVRFRLDDQIFERRLVPQVEDAAIELNISSPVGERLLLAGEGDEMQVAVPAGVVVVKVLAIC